MTSRPASPGVLLAAAAGLFFLIAARPAGSQTAVTLSPAASPGLIQPGVTVANLTGNNFPAGTLVPAQTTLTLSPASSTAKTAQTYLYAANTQARTVSVVHPDTRQVIKTIPVSGIPEEVAVTPDGRKVYVTTGTFDQPGAVEVIDAATFQVVKTVSTQGTFARGLAIAPDGKKAYAGNLQSHTVAVFDLETDTVTALIPGLSRPIGLLVSPDSARLYVANSGTEQAPGTLSIIDTSTQGIIGTVTGLGLSPHNLVQSPDGRRVYVANDLSGSISVVDTVTRTLVATIPTAGTHANWPALNRAGTKLYATDYTANTVFVVDTATLQVTGTIPVGAEPYGVVLDPSGTRAWVACNNVSEIWALDLTANQAVGYAVFPTGAGAFGLALSPAAAPPVLSLRPSAIAAIAGSTRRLTFQVPVDGGSTPGVRVATATPYLARVSGTTAEGVQFNSGNAASLTLAPDARIVSVSPNTGTQGLTVNVVVTTQNTNFVNGATRMSFGPGIAVGGAAEGALGPVTVTSPTTATAPLRIGTAAAPGPRTVGVATGVQQATLAKGFTVAQATPPSLTSVNPNTGRQGQQNLAVTIIGLNTNFTAGIAVNFGAGIAVNAVTVNSPTNLTANLSIAADAAPGGRTVAVGALSLPNGFAVLPGVPVLLSVNPKTGHQGQQNLAATITGLFTHFAQGSSQVNFGEGVTVNSVAVTSATSLTANISIAAGATLGPRSVSVTTGSEVATLSGGFTVVAPPNRAPTITSNPPQFRRWIQQLPVGTPPSGRSTSGSSSQAYDDGNDRLMFFGGHNLSNYTSAFSDVWVLANAFGLAGSPTWIQLAPAPGPAGRINHTVVYARGSNRLIIHGGNRGGASQPVAPDTWVLTNANGLGGTPTWIRLPDGPARSSHAAVYDAAGNRMIMFGGFNGSNLSDVWVLADADGVGNPAWTQLNPTGTPPAGRDNAAAFYDAATNRLVLFGGVRRNVGASHPYLNLGDAWVLTNANGLGGTPEWIQLVPVGDQPAAREAAAFLYDPTSNEAILFGGLVEAPPSPFVYESTNDVWILRNANGLGGAPQWVPAATLEGPPLGRFFFTAARSPATGRVTVALGRSDSTVPLATPPESWYLNDVWTLKPPAVPGTVAKAFVYDVDATDPDPGDLLTYSLDAAPTGMSIQSATGLIQWTPSQTGSFNVTARVTDSGGLFHTQTFTVVVDVQGPSISVNAGPDQTVPLATGATLTGTVTPVGLPAGTTLINYWTKIIGPGSVSFANTAATSTVASFGAAGTYLLRLSAHNLSVSGQDEVSITVTGSATPVLVSATPNSAQQGQQNLAVTIAGQFTNFAQNTSQVSFGAGISVNSATVASPTSLTANISVATNAAAGSRAITVTTGTEVVSLADGFNVIAVTATPILTSMAPASGRQGQTLTSTITGQNTHWVQNATTVDLGSGIAVNSVTVTNATSLSVQITIAANATVGTRPLTVTTGSEAVTAANVFTVNPGLPVLLSLSPSAGQQGQTLPVTITGQFTNFAQGATQVSFGAGITVNSVSVANATTLTANISIAFNAATGARTVTVTTGTETASLPSGFTVQLTVPVLITLVPAAAQQGQQNVPVTVTGQATNFVQGTSTANFGAGITVNSVSVTSATSLTASLNVAFNAAVGPRTVTVTTGTEVVTLTNGFAVQAGDPALTIISPFSGRQGQTLNVSLTAQFTNWVQGTTTANFGAGITVNSVTVTDATHLTANLTIAVNAAIGSRAVSVTTGTQVLSAPDAFDVLAGLPVILSANPNTGTQGQQNLNVAIVGQFTNFVQGTSQVSIGDFGVAVNSVTVANATSLNANISLAANAALGARPVTVTTGVEVASLANGFTVQAAPNQAPVITIAPTWSLVLPSRLTITYTVTDDGKPAGGALTVSWDKISGPGVHTFSDQTTTSISVGFDAPGTYVLRITATDTQFTVFKDITVDATGTPLPPPTVSLATPIEGQEITTLTDVFGTVNSPSLASWTLEYRMQEETFFRSFATGTANVANARLGTFDPTLLLNGIALIRLTARDTVGQTATTEPVSVVLTKNLKVGHFTVSFKDLEVPLAGIGIQVIRTYDSRSPLKGDFGVGWTLDIRNVRLRDNGKLGINWQGTRTGTPLNRQYCIEPTKEHVVTVILSDGTVYKFRPVITPSCQQFVPILQAQITFAQVSGPAATLALAGNNKVVTLDAWPGPLDLLDESTLQAVDYENYRLTLSDGRVLAISRAFGLQSLTDLNQHTITITANGITHSSGKGITFLRDAAGRITRITDPSGQTLNYAYDGAGDLTSFTDQVNNTSTYAYDANHRLLKISDPRGIEPLRNEYDADGRLIKNRDAFGNEINYTHDFANHREIVTDRLGNQTVNEYDGDGNVITVTDALGGITRREYDARGNVTREINPLGKVRTYTYDERDNRLTETDPLGNVTRYTYNNFNQVQTITDAFNRVTSNSYDNRGNLTRTVDPMGNATNNTYGAVNGLITSSTDALGNTTSYENDDFNYGIVLSQTDPLGNKTTYGYDGNNRRTAETRTRTTPSGTETLSTGFGFDGAGRLLHTTHPDGTTTRTVYNSLGKQAETYDQLNRKTTYTYDAMGRLTQTTFPDGASERSEYDAEGRRTRSIDRAGRATQYQYDKLGRLTRTIFPDNTSNETVYDAAGQVIRTIDARGNATRYDYDDAGRRIRVTNALNEVTEFTYDQVGNQTTLKDGNGNQTTYQYDAVNRRTKVTYPDATFDQTDYDAVGRTIRKIDQAGKITQFGYDKMGRLLTVTDALNQVTSYSYDEVGNRITQTDALGRTTRFEYDKVGRRTRRVLPLQMAETAVYDTVGNLREKIDFNGKRTQYAYDANNRLTSKTPDPSFNAPATTFTYTATGQRASMVDPSGTTTYQYDPRDRVTSVAAPAGTLTYTYDAQGNLATIRSSNLNGTSVDYTYDALNRLSSVRDNRLTAGTTAYTYDQAGNLKSYTYPNGVSHTYTYNPLNRLTNLAVTTATATLASYAYTLAPAGNRTRVVEFGGRTVDYTYDDLYRLKQETIAAASDPTKNGAIGYVYDAVGNRLQRTSTIGVIPAQTFTYDNNDRLSSDTCDANGNTVGSGGVTYAYDYENRLLTKNGTEVVMAYNADGDRVVKTVGGVTTRYLVDHRNLTGYSQVLEEVVGGAVARVYTYGLNRISQSQVSGTSFYGYDGHGSVRLLTDSSGAVTDRYDYDAFGITLQSLGTTVNEYLYGGESFDSSLNLYHLRARYFAGSIGRFWTLDGDSGRSRSAFLFEADHDSCLKPISVLI